MCKFCHVYQLFFAICLVVFSFLFASPPWCSSRPSWHYFGESLKLLTSLSTRFEAFWFYFQYIFIVRYIIKCILPGIILIYTYLVYNICFHYTTLSRHMFLKCLKCWLKCMYIGVNAVFSWKWLQKRAKSASKMPAVSCERHHGELGLSRTGHREQQQPPSLQLNAATPRWSPYGFY